MVRKILVLFVEPMLYIMDLIEEVYKKTPYEFQFIFCYDKLTGKDDLHLPQGTVICSGDAAQRRKQVKEIFRQFDPDFAIINGYVGVEQTAVIRQCQKNKVPYAIETDTPLHVPGNALKAVLKKLYLKTLLQNPLCYGFPGGTLQKENLMYYGIPEERCHIMPMCVSTSRLREEADKLPDKDAIKASHGLAGKDVFLFVGRLEQVKNVPVLLHAFSELKKENPNAALLIVGDGSEAVSLEEMAANMQDVHFAGYVVFPELVEYYKLADVFVLPSCYEPWGLVVNEALALGLPVVVSDQVGCRKDLIAEDKNGYIFASGDFCELKSVMLRSMALRQPMLDLTQTWNYEMYYQGFTSAVEQIC